MPTDPLTGSRYPNSGYAPNVPQDIQNAVFDLSDNTIPFFTSTSARDTAYANWVNAGGAMRNGLVCTVGDVLYKYSTSTSAWRPVTGESLFFSGAGGFDITTTVTAPTGGASGSVPAGTWLIFFRASFAVSASTGDRQINLHLYQGATQVIQTGNTVETASGSKAFAIADFIQVTLASAATMSLRVSANATGGTQAINANSIWAVRVG